jgi:hypothetical protein
MHTDGREGFGFVWKSDAVEGEGGPPRRQERRGGIGQVASFCAGGLGCMGLHPVAASGFVLRRRARAWGALEQVGTVWRALAGFGACRRIGHAFPRRSGCAAKEGVGRRGKAWHPETGSLGEGGVVVRAWCLHLLGGWCAAVMIFPRESWISRWNRGFFGREGVALCASWARTGRGVKRWGGGGWGGSNQRVLRGGPAPFCRRYGARGWARGGPAAYVVGYFLSPLRGWDAG